MIGYSLAPEVFDALLNSLGEGFVLFGRDGVCVPVYSHACEELLEIRPAGLPIADDGRGVNTNAIRERLRATHRDELAEADESIVMACISNTVSLAAALTCGRRIDS